MREHAHESIPWGTSRDEGHVPRYRDPIGPSGHPQLLAQLPEVDRGHLATLAAAVDAADYQRAVAAVRDGWFDLVRVHRSSLRKVLEKLPPGIVRESPLLAMLSGLTYYGVPHHRVRALRLFVVATRAASSGKRGVAAVDRALILTSASVSYRLIGRPKHGVTAARGALRVLHRMTEEERSSVHVLSRLYAQLGTTLYDGGQVTEALDAFEHGLAEIPTDGYPHGFTNVSMLAGIHALRGELPEAEEYLELARHGSWTDVARSAYPGTYYRLAEATAALERFDAVAARAHLVAMLHDRRTIEHWIPIATTEALTELIDGKPGAALAGLDAYVSLRRSEGRSTATRAKIAPTRALLQLALGNPDAAHAILQRDAAPGPSKSIGLARVELSLGHHGAALQHVRSTAVDRMPQRLAAELATVEAAVLLRFSTRARARAVVDHLGNILHRTDQRLAVTLVPEVDFQRLRAALADAGHDRVVERLPLNSFFPDPDPGTLLTEREVAVLHGLLQSPSVAAIAAELVVSVNTVKTQLKSLYRKLGVSNRDHAIAVALERHLVLAPDSDTRRPGVPGSQVEG